MTTERRPSKKPKQQESIAQQAQAAAESAQKKAEKARAAAKARLAQQRRSSLVYKVITSARTATAQPRGGPYHNPTREARQRLNIH